jgi:Cu/Ag efflux protein CusF
MFARTLSLALVLTLLATASYAQFGGGGGGGGGGRHGGGGGGHGSGSDPAAAAPVQTPPPKPLKPESQIEITGVVQAIDPAAQRVTIAYDAVDELGWPHGIMAFGVYRSDLIKAVTVGERVRFRLDAQQITEIAPF